MINLKHSLLDRPLGLMPLLTVLLTLLILTAMLGTMVWSRISLLQNGTEVVLKTAPVDPRDLLRGYFVRLRYDISRMKLKELAGWNEDRLIPLKNDGFKRHEKVYVELRQQESGFWSPYWVHRSAPDQEQDSVYIRGSVRSYSCLRRTVETDHCSLTLRYGIEKFFADKKRARKLEDLGRRTTKEITKLRKQILELQKSYRRPSNRQSGLLKPLGKERSAKLALMRKKLSKLVEQNRLDMAKRFAVIVRLDKQSGEAAISGLQLDGKRIYEERLF